MSSPNDQGGNRATGLAAARRPSRSASGVTSTFPGSAARLPLTPLVGRKRELAPARRVLGSPARSCDGRLWAGVSGPPAVVGAG